MRLDIMHVRCRMTIDLQCRDGARRVFANMREGGSILEARKRTQPQMRGIKQDRRYCHIVSARRTKLDGATISSSFREISINTCDNSYTSQHILTGCEYSITLLHMIAGGEIREVDEDVQQFVRSPTYVWTIFSLKFCSGPFLQPTTCRSQKCHFRVAAPTFWKTAWS